MPAECLNVAGDGLDDLTVYPDAAHGFLFQHHTEFAAHVEAFLADAS